MTPNFKLTLPWLLLLVLLTLWLLNACSAMPSCAPTAQTLIPPLPEQARQPTTPSGCSPRCSEALTTLREGWRLRLTPTASPGSPASAPTNP